MSRLDSPPTPYGPISLASGSVGLFFDCCGCTCGIWPLFIAGMMGVVALFTGYLGRAQAVERDEPDSLSTVGMVLGIVDLLYIAVYFVMMMMGVLAYIGMIFLAVLGSAVAGN